MCGWCSFKEQCSEFGGRARATRRRTRVGSVEHWDLVLHDQDGASSGLG